METKKIVLGAVAYTVGTFTLAVVWHILLFEDQYRTFGYIEDEPNFVIGFVTILAQGALLSLLFPMFRIAGTGIVRGLKFVVLMGAFFWTSHVLAFIAKQTFKGWSTAAYVPSGYETAPTMRSAQPRPPATGS